MYEAQSSYMKDLIAQTRFADRKRVNELLAVERYAVNGRITGYVHGILITSLWNSERDAFVAILSELNPNLLEEWRSEEANKVRVREERERESQERTAAELQAWLAAGGLS